MIVYEGHGAYRVCGTLSALFRRNPRKSRVKFTYSMFETNNHHTETVRRWEREVGPSMAETNIVAWSNLTMAGHWSRGPQQSGGCCSLGAG